MKNVLGLLALFCTALVANAQTPTVAATNVVFSNKYCSEVNISWTNGNGVSRLVIASEGSAVTSLPANNTFYLPNPAFGFGHSFTPTQSVVYNGAGSSVTVTNLKNNTQYYFSVFEYNGGGTIFNYLTTAYPEASTTTDELTASLIIDDAYQCLAGNEFNFSTSITRTGTTPLSYSWRFGDGNTSTQAAPTHSYTDKGLYPVQLTVSTIGCEAVVTQTDTVAPDPDVSFVLDPSFADNTAIQCFVKPDGSPNFYEFLNTSFYDFLPTNVSNSLATWILGDGSIKTGNAIDHSYLLPGVYTVKLIVNSTFNNREFCTDSFDRVVTVKSSPIDTNLVEMDSVMCLNGNRFEFAHNSTDPMLQNTWFFGDGNSSTGSEVTHSYGNVGLYYITLEAIDEAGCRDTYLDSIEVVPQPNNSIGTLNATYCQGDPAVQLQATIASGLWLGDAVDAQGVFVPDMVGTNEVRYAVEVDGCKDTASLITLVANRPFFELGVDTTICAGTTFEKAIARGSAAALWSTGGTDSFVQVDSEGILWAQLTEDGCTYRDSMRVGVIGAPIFSLGRDTTLCGGSSRFIDVSAPEATYVWSDGFSGPTRSINSSGNYSVTVTNKCGTTTENVELNFLPFACDIFVPNAFSPNGDGLNDVFKPTGNIELKSMQIFNRWGQLLYESSLENFAWDGTYESDRVKSDHYFFIIRYEKPEAAGAEPLQVSGEVFLMR